MYVELLTESSLDVPYTSNCILNYFPLNFQLSKHSFVVDWYLVELPKSSNSSTGFEKNLKNYTVPFPLFLKTIIKLFKNSMKQNLLTMFFLV